MFEKLKSKLNHWFNPHPAGPLAVPETMPTTKFASPVLGAPWWRNPCFTPAMSHKLRNDKGLMYEENTLLQNLVLRHFKEVA